MGKNILFSIALCVGLMLPNTSFGAQQQGWLNWIREGFKSRAQALPSSILQWDLRKSATDFVNSLSDNQKKALLAALTVALVGTAGAAYYYSHPKQQPPIQPGLPVAEALNPLHFSEAKPIIDKTNLYASSNMNNIALFFQMVESKSAPKLENLEEKTKTKHPTGKSFTQNMFDQTVLPVLDLLQTQIPKKPTSMEDTKTQLNYINQTLGFWRDLIARTKKQKDSIDLRKFPFYLQKLQQYISQQDKTMYEKLITSINDAAEHTKRSLSHFQNIKPQWLQPSKAQLEEQLSKEQLSRE